MHCSLSSLQRLPRPSADYCAALPAAQPAPCSHWGTRPGHCNRQPQTDSRTVARGILDSYRKGKGEDAAEIATDLRPGQESASATDDGCRAECVTQIFSQAEFDEELRNASLQTLVVVDFYKTACGSCRYIQPGFAKLCRNSGDHHAAVIFLKHNIIDEYDEPSELAEGLKIKAVPQFDFYMGSQLVERFATREKARIADAINKHAGEGTVVLSEIDRNLGQPAKP